MRPDNRKIKTREVLQQQGQVQLLSLTGYNDEKMLAVEVPDKFTGRPIMFIHFKMDEAKAEYERYVKFFDHAAS